MTKSPDSWLGPLSKNRDPSPGYPLHYESLGTPMLWQCFKCLISAVAQPWLGELITLPQNR